MAAAYSGRSVSGGDTLGQSGFRDCVDDRQRPVYVRGATIEGSATEAGFAFKSDTSLPRKFAIVGREQNGVLKK